MHSLLVLKMHPVTTEMWHCCLVILVSFETIEHEALSNKQESSLMHLIPKWRPINYSFVSMFIHPLCLTFTSKFFCFYTCLRGKEG